MNTSHNKRLFGKFQNFPGLRFSRVRAAGYALAMTESTEQTGAGADERRRYYLQAMDIDVWMERPGASQPALQPADRLAPAAVEAPVSEPQAQPDQPAPVLETPPVEPAGESPLNWQSLRDEVVDCQACGLHETRTQTVFGVGDQSADWLFVGEAPGADEDAQGEPFVGRAGKLLNAMLFALGLRREQVFIANVLKCRPPNNRDPHPDEVVACESFLQRQIQLLQPKIIVALGRHAAHSLLKTEQPLSRLRGQLHTYENTPLIVTYHPAYLLRSPAEKARAWADLRMAKRQVAS